MASKALDISQLAAYLHITPQKVRKLIDRGHLPARKVGGEWLVPEADVHSWLEAKIGTSEIEDLPEMRRVIDRWSDDKKQDVSIHQLIAPEAVEVPLAARTRTSVVRRMSMLAERSGLLWDAAKMTEAVLAREDLHPTALDSGVALLHPRRPQTSILAQPLLGLGISSQPLPFGNASGNLTDIFFLICSTDDKVHLQLLAKLSQLVSSRELLSELREATSSQQALDAITRFENELDDAHA